MKNYTYYCLTFSLFLLLLSCGTSEPISSRTTTETKPSANSGNENNFRIVERAPIYPGCENEATNRGRKECMGKKIQEFVIKNFRIKKVEPLLQPGIKKIFITFSINQDGKVGNIKIHAPHVVLEEEAKRTISRLPRMQPGMIKGKPVEVKYSFPIIMNVEAPKTSEEQN